MGAALMYVPIMLHQARQREEALRKKIKEQEDREFDQMISQDHENEDTYGPGWPD